MCYILSPFEATAGWLRPHWTPGLWVQCPSTPLSAKLWVLISDGSGAWVEACWDSVPGSPTGHHHCVIHSTHPATCVPARSPGRSVFHFFWPVKTQGFLIAPHNINTQLQYLSWKLPWAWYSTVHAKISFSFSWVLWSQGSELMKKKKLLEARLPFLFLYCWFSVWGQFCLFIGSGSGQVYLVTGRVQTFVLRIVCQCVNFAQLVCSVLWHTSQAQLFHMLVEIGLWTIRE